MNIKASFIEHYEAGMGTSERIYKEVFLDDPDDLREYILYELRALNNISTLGNYFYLRIDLIE